MKYAVYISGNGTAIRTAIKENEKFGSKIKIVISDNSLNQYLKNFYEDRGISYHLYDFKQIPISKKEKNRYFSDKLLDLLKKNQIDYCLCFGNHLLKGNLLKEYEYRIINFHPSLLPLYPGMHAIEQALCAGENILGNTAHFINEGVDSGPIILQNVFLTRNYLEKGYGAVFSEQVALILKIDELLSERRIRIVDNKVIIDKADYSVSYIYPNV